MARRTRSVEPEVATGAEEVEVLEQETGGMGLDIGLVCTTAFFLLAAIVMILLVLKRDYQAGPLA